MFTNFLVPSAITLNTGPSTSMDSITDLNRVKTKDNAYPPEVSDAKLSNPTLIDIDTMLNTTGLEEKAIIRKIDYRLVPWLSLLYLLSFLDR